MFKKELKLLTFFIVFILLLYSFSFAAKNNVTEADIAPISAPLEEESTEDDVSNIRNGDLYLKNEKNYTLKESRNGNIFANAKNFTINPKENGGEIQGNLYVTARTVTLQSDVKYSDNQQDDNGEKSIESITASSVIYGNAFICTDELILEPGSVISGDLYVIADKIEISTGVYIYGSVFAISNNIKLDGLIKGDLYATTKTFTMNYYGCVTRDLHLDAQKTVINGLLYGNAFINSNNLTTTKDFVVNGNFDLTSKSAILLGDFKRKFKD